MDLQEVAPGITTQAQAEDLGALARAGLRWQFLLQVFGTTMQLATSIVLARLLMPKDFGIVGMCLMVLGLIGLLGNLGTGEAIIQRKEIEPRHLRAVFWSTLLLAAGEAGLLLLAAPLIASFFRDPRLASVLPWFALPIVIGAFATVPGILLARAMDFRKSFIKGVILHLCYAAVAIPLALRGYSYWSLVWAAVIQSIVGLIVLYALTRYRPPLVPSLRGFRDLAGYGIGVTGVSALNYVAGQADYFVVGRWLGAAPLGLYTRAFNLMSWPMTILSFTVNPVLFPALSRIQDNPGRIRQAFSMALTAMSLVAFPSLALLGVTAPELIPALLGPHWDGAIVPTQIMCGAGMLKVITTPGCMLVRATGRVYGEMWRTGLYAAVLAGGAWYGSHWGIVGVAWAALTAAVVFYLGIAQLVYSCSGFGFRATLTALRPALLSAACTFAVAAGARYMLLSVKAPAVVALLGALVLGAGAGLLAILYGPFKEWHPAWDYVVTRRRKSAAGNALAAEGGG